MDYNCALLIKKENLNWLHNPASELNFYDIWYEIHSIVYVRFA